MIKITPEIFLTLSAENWLNVIPGEDGDWYIASLGAGSAGSALSYFLPGVGLGIDKRTKP